MLRCGWSVCSGEDGHFRTEWGGQFDRILQLVGASSGINDYDVAFSHCEIENSIFPRFEEYSNCDIEFCDLGNSTSTTDNVSNCWISDSKLFVKESFADNRCENTSIEINNNVKLITISGNYFFEERSSESNLIIINRTYSSAPHSVKISDNTFRGDLSSTNHILITGTYTGNSYNSIVHIVGNSFTKGSKAVDMTSTNVKVIFSENVLDDLPNMGVSGSDTYINDNTIL